MAKQFRTIHTERLLFCLITGQLQFRFLFRRETNFREMPTLAHYLSALAFSLFFTAVFVLLLPHNKLKR